MVDSSFTRLWTAVELKRRGSIVVLELEGGHTVDTNGGHSRAVVPLRPATVS